MDLLVSIFETFYRLEVLMLSLPATLFLLFGLFIFAVQIWRTVKGENVELKVLAMHEKQKQKKNSDQVRITFQPEFEVLTGAHAGFVGLAPNASNPPIHEAGEIVKGLYIAGSDAIASEVTSLKGYRDGYIFAAILAGFGCALMIPVLID